MSVRYDGARDPGSADTVDSAELTEGANCQLFAYALLLHFGRSVPPLRSSDLWEDARYTRRVADLLPLDLLLWNHTPDPWGAHVGVYLGDRWAVHLSREVGVPAVWPLTAFPRHPRYRVFIGAKRVVRGG